MSSRFSSYAMFEDDVYESERRYREATEASIERSIREWEEEMAQQLMQEAIEQAEYEALLRFDDSPEWGDECLE